jgi:hypothetical protein
MSVKKAFKEFHKELSSSFPSETFEQFKETDPSEFEELVTPIFFKIIQKNKAIFETEFKVFGVDVSPLFPKKPEMFWRNIQKCSISAFLSGDIKSKVNNIAKDLKKVWGGSGQSTDELEKLLGTEESRSKISEILEFVMTTRIAKVVINLAETLDISEFGIDMENPEELMKKLESSELNPIIEKIGKKVKTILEDKLRRGEFTKEMLAADVQQIQLKIQTAFGDVFNDMLGGRKAEVDSQVILGNSPEARRARMIARLRRKLAERKDAE